MANDKQRKLVETLHRKTLEGKIDWREPDFSIENNIYHLDLSMHSLRISRDRGPNNETMIYITLLNDEGKVVEIFNDEDIEPDTSDRKYYRLMLDLHEMAGRRAMGADKVLDEILNELDDDLPF